MATIDLVSHYESPPDGTGRRNVSELYVLSDGRTMTFSWLGSQDVGAVIEQRKQAINQQLATEAEAQALVASSTLPITKLAFRRRFTFAERVAIDAFNTSFESNQALTAETKAAIRTANLDFSMAEDVRLDDEGTIAGVMLYASLGLIAPERAQEVLNG